MFQEIDGQALMLLQADHLMTAMSIKVMMMMMMMIIIMMMMMIMIIMMVFLKLGPALKICQEVKSLKDELAKN